MQRYFIEFSYFGKNYFGYQRQPREISVQEVLENALSTKLRTEIKITGAGRTDTGVHAKKMFAHFETKAEIDENLVYQLNSLLPQDITIFRVFRVSDHFHARFDATFRTYEYHISLEKNSFNTDFCWQMRHAKLNIEKMNEACKILFDFTDFTSFSKVNTETKTNNCKIFKAVWEQNNFDLKFTISADRFLRNMVRAIVGTLVEVGTGKISVDNFKEIVAAKNRNLAGTSAPAKGLFLVDVGYNF